MSDKQQQIEQLFARVVKKGLIDSTQKAPSVSSSRVQKGTQSGPGDAQKAVQISASVAQKSVESKSSESSIRLPVALRVDVNSAEISTNDVTENDDEPVIIWRDENAKDKRKGGRPRLENARTISLSCMVSREERELIRKQAAEHNIPMSQLLRMSVFDILNKQRLPKQRGLTDEARKLLLDLSRVGGNLNQISRNLNSRPTVALTASDVAVLKEQVHDLHETVRELKKSLKSGVAK